MEYCIAAMAVSPCRRYSNDSADHSLTNPVLVEVTTRIALRSHALVRSISARTRFLVSSRLRSLSTLAKTRMGCFASSSRVTTLTRAALGPEAMNDLPSAPMLSHGTRDPGPTGPHR